MNIAKFLTAPFLKTISKRLFLHLSIYVFIHLLACLRFPLDEMTGDFAMKSRRNYFATKSQAETRFSFHMNTLTRLLKTLSKIRLLLIKIKLRIKINELWVFVFLGPRSSAPHVGPRPRGRPVP